jgi:hypothetical protein
MTRTHEQLAAMERFAAAVASLGAVRVVPNGEGWPVMLGRLGTIEWFCDGVDCHACSLPGALALAVFTTRRRLHGPLLALPGVTRHQRGDDELRVVFLPTPELLAAAAAIIHPRRRRAPVPTPARLAALARGRQARAESGHRATSQALHSPSTVGPDPEGLPPNLMARERILTR